jgi:beta-galactosidase
MEDRQVIREKYSELKLQAGMLQASPTYLLSEPDSGSYGLYTNSTTLANTRLSTNSTTSFYIIRHGDLVGDNTVSYTLQVSTSLGNLSIPQLGGSLSLHGRDSKIHVVDYDLGGVNLIYSSAEIFSWKKTASEKSVLVLYGGEGETHESAVPGTLAGSSLEIEGEGLIISGSSTATIINWSVEPSRRVVHFGDQLDVYLLWRNEAYNYWTLDLSLPEPIHRHTSSAASRASGSVIVKAGYLVRTAEIDGNALKLRGDVNVTTEIEVSASPSVISTIYFNE